MKISHSPEQALAMVEKSPAAVAAHDKAAWISIFADYNIVEDPYGSQAHVSGVFDRKSGTRSQQALARFFDTFIAPNEIRFHVERDIVCDNHVVRDLSIEITMSSTVTTQVPMHLLYELTEQDGELRILRLAAYWELWPMIRQVLSKGAAALGVLQSLGFRMLSIQGLSGALGFMRGFFGIGETGKRTVREFVQAFNARQSYTLESLFSSENAGIDFPFGTASCSPQTLLAETPSSLQVSKLLAAGYSVTCRCEITDDQQLRHGVAIFEFNARTKKIDRVVFYWN